GGGAVVGGGGGGRGGGGGAVSGGANAAVVGTTAALARALWWLFLLVLLGELENADWDSWTPRAASASAELARTMGIETDADGRCLRILRLLEVTGARRASGVAWECGQPVDSHAAREPEPPSGRLGTTLGSVRG